MQNIANLLPKEEVYTHSLKLLQKIIISIESYPELKKTSQLEILETSNQPITTKKIETDYQYETQKVKKTNIKTIKELLLKIEKHLENQQNQTLTKNINIRIEYLKDKKLKEIYQKEQVIYQKNTEKLKRILQEELNKTDITLQFYAQITKVNKKYQYEETLSKFITLSQFFEKYPLEELIKDIKLEDYLENYYKQLGTDQISIEFYKLYPVKTTQKLEKIRQSKHPALKLAKTIKPLSPKNGTQLVTISQKNADLTIKIEQLENLKKYLTFDQHPLTISYIEHQISITKNQIINNNTIATKIWNNIIEEISLNKKIQTTPDDYQIKKLLTEILKTIKQESKIKFNYDLGDNEYRTLIKKDLLNYQNNLLKNKYNLNITIQELEKKLQSTDQKSSSNSSPKLKITNKVLTLEKKITKYFYK